MLVLLPSQILGKQSSLLVILKQNVGLVGSFATLLLLKLVYYELQPIPRLLTELLDDGPLHISVLFVAVAQVQELREAHLTVLLDLLHQLLRVLVRVDLSLLLQDGCHARSVDQLVVEWQVLGQLLATSHLEGLEVERSSKDVSVNVVDQLRHKRIALTIRHL